MNNWADRERAIANALRRTRPLYPWARCLREARGFIAMCNADRAFDAAQEPKATARAEPAVVETVREALGRLDKSGTTYAFPGARWKADVGAWVPIDTATHLAVADAALAIILNNVPALLELAKRGAHCTGVHYTDRYSQGVIKGLERAKAGAIGAGHYNFAARIDATIARIRSGGEIEPSVDPARAAALAKLREDLAGMPPLTEEDRKRVVPVNALIRMARNRGFGVSLCPEQVVELFNLLGMKFDDEQGEPSVDFHKEAGAAFGSVLADAIGEELDRRADKRKDDGEIKPGVDPTSTGTENLARFGHHPDPANDFCVEVEVIEGLVYDLNVGLFADRGAVEKRIARAMQFTVGADEIAVKAKARLREIERAFHKPSGDSVRKQDDILTQASVNYRKAAADLNRMTDDGEIKPGGTPASEAGAALRSCDAPEQPAPQEWFNRNDLRELQSAWWAGRFVQEDKWARILAMADAALTLRQAALHALYACRLGNADAAAIYLTKALEPSTHRNVETPAVGAVTDVPSDCVSRSAAPEQPNPAAGGAPQDQNAAIDGIGKVGDVVWYRPRSGDGPEQKATLRVVYQDGDAEIEFDDGTTATVKWRSLYPGPPLASQLPKGWMDAVWVRNLRVFGLPAAHVRRDLSVGEVDTLCIMADAALTLRHAASIALAELSGPPSLDRFHNARNVLRLALDAAEKPNG